jgi:hypothetical protein
MSANLGFETIGNATLTAFDSGKPILTTDPWVEGSPYFGSWGHAYEIPSTQRENIYNSKYMWISHGHPDHLDSLSIEQFKDTVFLVPDHYGNRIYDGMIAEGFNAQILASNEWLQLSPNIRVKNFSDWNQDAVLLVAIGNDDIIVNLNDGRALGWSRQIKKEIKSFSNRFLLKLCGWGDSDMINYYDIDGNFVQPPAASKPPVGKMYDASMVEWNCNFAIPFSSSHRYQRTDSLHINEFATPLKDHYYGFDGQTGELLPAFISWESEIKSYTELKPKKLDKISLSPEEFGDNWSDQLEAQDVKLITNYFGQIEHLKTWLGNVHFEVGGVRNTIKLSEKNTEIIFKTPRNSLITAINYEIFDDLLIGNFMKTTLINVDGFGNRFTPYVTKYADNGLVKSHLQLKNYFKAYHQKSGFNYLIDRFMFKSEDVFRKFISPNTKLYQIAKPLKNAFR